MRIIGRTDKADFPELSLSNIHIKIDTGAYTSSIHSHDIKEELIDGVSHIVFQIMDPEHPKYHDKEFKTSHFKKKQVKNSFGITEERYVVQTIIVLFGETYPIDLSLSERSDMKYPILIGRKLLNRRFSVDPARKNLSYRQKQAAKKSKTEK